MTRPDFVVVGAPKCGTTSLHRYLSQSPYVYVPKKELHFFGADLEFSLPTPTEEEYERHFSEAGARLAGDVDVWYLYSKTSAAEIHEYVTDARIIIMVRNPVDFMYSMHSQAVYSNEEPVHSFEDALALEGSRRRGQNLHSHYYVRHATLYRDIARFSEQIQRYRDQFSSNRIHYILLDDLTKDTRHEWSRLCSFLGILDDGFAAFDVVNPNKQQRWPAIGSADTMIRRRLVPGLGLDRLPDRVKSLGKGALRMAQRWNTEYVERSPMNPVLRAALLAEFEEEIAALEQILGRDLSNWRR